MKTRSLLLAAALASAACNVGKTTDPTDDPTPAPTSFQSWAGTARFSETRELPPNGGHTVTYEATITWQRDDNFDPSLPLPAGAARYKVASGQMHVVYRGTRNFQVPAMTCTDEGAADVAVGTYDDPDLRSHLDLGPDGVYNGSIFETATVTITRRCPNGFVGSLGSSDFRTGLFVRGTLTADRRIRGEMPPETGVGSTESGSWDFGPR